MVQPQLHLMAVPLVNGYVLIAQLPDWMDGVRNVLQWQTEIALAQRGFEDRAGLRPLPMATLTWQVVTTTAMAGAALEDAVRAALRSGQACVPCWPRPTYGVVGILGASFAFEATQWPWQPGDYFVAFGADGTPYVSTIQAQVPAADVFTITTPIPAGCTQIFPLLFGRLETDTSEQEGPDTLALQCRLHVPAWRLPGASAALLNYNGSPVVPAVVVTDWSDQVTRTFAYDPSVQQIGFGAETLEIEQSYVQHGIQMSTWLTTDSAISDLESFVGGLGGRRGNFWLPGRERAMIVSGGLSSTNFLIEGQGLADTWGDQPDLILYFTAPGQAPQIGRISSVVPGPDGMEEVILDAALAVAIDAAWDVFRLRLMRLGDDKLEEDYDADGMATVQVTGGGGSPGVFRRARRRAAARVPLLVQSAAQRQRALVSDQPRHGHRLPGQHLRARRDLAPGIQARDGWFGREDHVDDRVRRHGSAGGVPAVPAQRPAAGRGLPDGPGRGRSHGSGVSGIPGLRGKREDGRAQTPVGGAEPHRLSGAQAARLHRRHAVQRQALRPVVPVERGGLAGRGRPSTISPAPRSSSPPPTTSRKTGLPVATW